MTSGVKITGGTGPAKPTPKTTFDKAIEHIIKYPRTSTGELKQKLFKFLKVSNKGYIEYYKKLDEAGTAAYILNEYLELIVTAENATWIDYSSAFMKWSNKHMSGTVQPDHKEYTNITLLLTTIYNALLRIKADTTLILGQSNGDNATESGKPTSSVKGYDRSALFKYRNNIEMDAVIERFRKLMMISFALTKVDPLVQTLTPEDVNKILKDFVTKPNQGVWKAWKKTGVNVLSGKADLNVQVTTSAFNQKTKGQYEQQLGMWSQAILAGKGPITDSNLAKITKNVKFDNLVGSKGLRPEITRQLSEILTKKRSSASGSMTRKSGGLKEKGMPPLPVIIPKALKSLSLTAKGQIKKKPDQVTNIAALNKLRNVIQKRLPAEVRRQMGRPALINRTSRFSNSVELLNLRETAAGISGEYTYQLNPYQTFENTGSRKWPLGYNPKPLISKSIRNLALQYTEEKLTSLRRR